ncbi:hypothetical protein C8Q77DRAFT_344654 [Trametes polyzona]|nr:hypothetical protein C8Q77DRAFT_344654 [Trametes polyzona]
MLQYLRELRARYLSPHPKTRPSPVSTEDTRLRHNVRTRWPRLGDFTLDSLKLCMDLDDETPWPSSSLLALRRPLPISICSTVTTFVGLGLCGIPPPTASRYASRFSPSPPSPHSDCGSPCSTGKGDCLIVVSSAPVATSSSRDDHRAGSPASFLSTPDTNVLSKVNRSQGACSSTAAQWPPSPVTPLDPSYLTTAPDGAAAPRSSLESNKAQDTQENPSSLLFPEQELLNPSLDPTVGDVIQRETFSRAGGTDCGREQRRVVRRKPPPIQIISSPSFPKPDDVSESAEPTTEHELVANPDAGQARQHPTPVIADILPFPHGTATTHRSEDSVYDDAQITNHSSLERVQNDVHLARVAGHPPEAILYVPLAQLLAGTGTLPPAYDFGPGLVPCVPIYGLRAEEIERRYAHHTMADESGCSGHSLDVEVPLDARPQINANLDTGLPNPQRIFGTFPPPPGLPPPAAMPDALAAGNFGDRNENSSGWHIPRASLHDDNKHGAPATSTALQPGLPLPYDYQWPRCESPSQLESLDDLVTLPALPALEDQLGMNELQLSFPNDNALGPPHGLGPPFERLDTALRDLPQDGISPSFPPVVVANDLRSDYDEIVDHCEGHRTIAWGTADGGEPSGTDTSSLDCPNESPPGPPLTKEGSLVIERQPWHARTLYYDDPDTQKSPSLRCDGVSFDMVAEIATGSVGRVFAISRKNSLYAVKVIHKWRAYAEYYCDRNMMIQEKEALVCVSNARQKSPYLAHLLMSWEDEVSVYFLMVRSSLNRVRRR